MQFPNGSSSNDLLIPPSITGRVFSLILNIIIQLLINNINILDLHNPEFHRTIIVEEGRSLNLSCSATGNPAPQVEWRREDGRTINVNGMESKFLAGFGNYLRYGLIKSYFYKLIIEELKFYVEDLLTLFWIYLKNVCLNISFHNTIINYY